MSRELKLKTILCWQEGEEDREACADVIYSVTRGYGPTMFDPGSPDEVEIISITRTDAGEPLSLDRWQYDDELIAECFQDWVEDCHAAEEYRAESMREARMLGDF